MSFARCCVQDQIQICVNLINDTETENHVVSYSIYHDTDTLSFVCEDDTVSPSI